MISACDHQEKPILSPPDFVQSYERTPFGTEHFKAFKRTMDPLWDSLKPEHNGLTLYDYAMSQYLSRSQVEIALKSLLGNKWMQDPSLSGQSDWGWSLGFRNNDYVYVFLAVEPQSVELPMGFAMVPAGIITNINIIADSAMNTTVDHSK